MLRSMFAAISGLRNHQTMMDVVGNNISNVNTTGFKSSQAVFSGGAQPDHPRRRRRRPARPAAPTRPRSASARASSAVTTELQPGRAAAHRPLDRLRHPGRRLLHRRPGRRAALHPGRLASRSTPSAASSPRTAASSRAGRPTRRQRRPPTARSATIVIPVGDLIPPVQTDDRPHRRQPARRRRGRHDDRQPRSTCYDGAGLPRSTSASSTRRPRPTPGRPATATSTPTAACSRPRRRRRTALGGGPVTFDARRPGHQRLPRSPSPAACCPGSPVARTSSINLGAAGATEPHEPVRRAARRSPRSTRTASRAGSLHGLHA